MYIDMQLHHGTPRLESLRIACRMLMHLQAICGMVLQTMSLGMCLLSSILHTAENRHAFQQYANAQGLQAYS